uniref:Reverse transcriptase domain-containing protein n=1 Tax=Angiostrongylus cantonensis TaxID=6313 RepID=A0A0K0DP94_ANGCA
MRTLEWDNMGVKIDSRQIHHLRFADDIVLITPDISQAERMLANYDKRVERMLTAFAFLLVYSEVATAFVHIRDPNIWGLRYQLQQTNNIHKRSPYKWTEEWLDGVPVDHFSFANKDNFKLRYFLNIEGYRPGGPIFFYTGNDGILESFAMNTVCSIFTAQ